MRWALLIMLGILLTGCGSSQGPRSFTFPALQYDKVFDVTRDELRRAGYTLERVDAANGELLTAPKVVAGLASPLEPESRSAGQLWQDTINTQPRTVRVTFRDTTGVETDEIIANVEVVLWRMRRPGWRLETEAIRSSSYWIDPALAKRGVRNGMLVPVRRDDRFAAEFTQRVRSRLEIDS